MTSLGVRALPPSARNALTFSHRSMVPTGNFWLHALSSDASSSSVHGFAAADPSVAAAAARVFASSAFFARSSCSAPSTLASASQSAATMASGSSRGSAASHSVLSAAKSSAPHSSSTSASPGWPIHPSALAEMVRRRAFSLRRSFFCFSSSFLALALASFAARLCSMDLMPHSA